MMCAYNMWMRVLVNNSFNTAEKKLSISSIKLSLLIGMLENTSPTGLAPLQKVQGLGRCSASL